MLPSLHSGDAGTMPSEVPMQWALRGVVFKSDAGKIPTCPSQKLVCLCFAPRPRLRSAVLCAAR